MTYNHNNNIAELVAAVGLTESDAFDYSNHDPYEVVEQYFQFCQTNLSEKCDQYQIQPARIYIRRKMDVNARAGKGNTYYIIAVNFGTILTLFRLYTDHRKIFENESLKEYRILNEQLDVSLDFLLFQISTQFTYYHELGHLIQKSPVNNTWIAESYESDNPEDRPYSLEKHVYEFDADLHAANHIAFHLLEYRKKQKEELRTIENLGLLLSLGVAAVLSYFIFLMRNYKKMYYKASTHPHPLIRISYIVDNFTKVADENIEPKGQFNATEIVRRGFVIVDSLFVETGNKWLPEFAAQFFGEQNGIEEYVNSVLMPQSKLMENLAMHKHQ